MGKYYTLEGEPLIELNMPHPRKKKLAELYLLKQLYVRGSSIAWSKSILKYFVAFSYVSFHLSLQLPQLPTFPQVTAHTHKIWPPHFTNTCIRINYCHHFSQATTAGNISMQKPIRDSSPSHCTCNSYCATRYM